MERMSKIKPWIMRRRGWGDLTWIQILTTRAPASRPPSGGPARPCPAAAPREGGQVPSEAQDSGLEEEDQVRLQEEAGRLEAGGSRGGL